MELLSALSHEYRSGAEIADQLGVTRAAVWKAVHLLIDQGYPVETQRQRGYRMQPGTPTPSALAPLLNGPIGEAYRYLARAGSTQDAMAEWSSEGAPHGAVVLAEQQTHGRGRRGRSWSSGEPGTSLLFSVLLRPSFGLRALPLVPLAAGIALAEGVAEAAGISAPGPTFLKWPNDLLAADGRKIAGILVDARTSGEEADHVIVGIGIDVHPAAPEGGAAISELVDHRVSRVQILASVLNHLEAACRLIDEPAKVIETWSRLSLMWGRHVTAATQAGDIEGTALRLNLDGSLVIAINENEQTSVSAGDVQLLTTGRSKTR